MLHLDCWLGFPELPKRIRLLSIFILCYFLIVVIAIVARINWFLQACMSIYFVVTILALLHMRYTK